MGGGPQGDGSIDRDGGIGGEGETARPRWVDVWINFRICCIYVKSPRPMKNASAL